MNVVHMAAPPVFQSIYEYVILDGKHFGAARYTVCLQLLISPIVARKHSGSKHK